MTEPIKPHNSGKIVKPVGPKPGIARQALLNALSATVRAAPGCSVRIEVKAAQCQLLVDLRPLGTDAGSLPEGCRDSLEMAGQLAELAGGALELLWNREGSNPLTVRLALPAIEQASVLIVDDNADTLRLFERYLSDTPYAYVGSSDPQQVLALALELKPRVIVLDVMLPGIDGWELLGRLRADPKTGGPQTYTRQDGTVGANFEVVANTIRFLSPKSEGTGAIEGEVTVEGAGGHDENIPF